MESSRRPPQRSRSARGPPPLPPPLHGRQPPTRTRRNPTFSPDLFDEPRYPMEDDAISTLMDIDDSPLNGAGFLDEDDVEGDLFMGHQRGVRGMGGIGVMEMRGPLPFAGFFNSFDGADFDDADLE